MTEDDAPTVECAVCGDDVSLKVAKSGWGRKPIHPECWQGLEGRDSG